MNKLAKQQGFVILFAVVVSALMALLMSGVYSQAIKESALTSTAKQSMIAFYMADSALECGFYDLFTDPDGPGDNLIDCFGNNNITATDYPPLDAYWFFEVEADVDSTMHQACAQIYIRDSVPNGGFVDTTEVVARGFSLCDNEDPIYASPQLLERRLRAYYEN